jgi:TonB family protein
VNRNEIPARALACVRTLLPLASLFCFSIGLQAQSSPQSAQPAPPSSQPTSSTVQPAPAPVQPPFAAPDATALAEAAVQTRILRARALIAAHQLETAATELESVRAASQDGVIHNITSVMLMGVYLEAGKYGRAEALLEEDFRTRSAQNGDSVRSYFAIAGQAVNGARAHLSRYRTVGINTLDSNLPPEAVVDLDRLRSFLERMIAQAKEVANERKAYDSLSLLEDVLGIRLSLAKDGADQAKWSTEYVAARELLAASPTQIASLRGFSALPPGKVKSNKSPSSLPYTPRRSSDGAEKKSSDKSEDAAHPRASNEPEGSAAAAQPQPQTQSTTQPLTQPPTQPVAPPPTQPKPDAAPATPAPAAKDQPLSDFGLLNAKASRRVLPRYPPVAKKAGTVGLVRVHVVVDESGKVVEISRSEGPALLKQVAEDAARQWSFEGIAGPGQPVRFTGYIDFNFTL